VLPTMLAILGVLVSLETPHLESHKAKWGVRAGLVIFGILVSVITWVQQKNSRDETGTIRSLLGTIADAVKVDRNNSAQGLAEEILKRLPSTEWHLEQNQKQKLGEILDSAPAQARFLVDIRALIGSTQSQMYKDDLANLFSSHNWQVTGGVDAGLRSDLVGLYIAISPEIKTGEEIPISARVLAGIFQQSNIVFQFAHRDGINKDAFQLNVGTRPHP